MTADPAARAGKAKKADDSIVYVGDEAIDILNRVSTGGPLHESSVAVGQVPSGGPFQGQHGSPSLNKAPLWQTDTGHQLGSTGSHTACMQCLQGHLRGSRGMWRSTPFTSMSQ